MKNDLVLLQIIVVNMYKRIGFAKLVQIQRSHHKTNGV